MPHGQDKAKYIIILNNYDEIGRRRESKSCPGKEELLQKGGRNKKRSYKNLMGSGYIVVF